MPNRILRESYLDSEPINKAGELAEVLFLRMLLVVDDFGRFDGRLSVICRRCWPLGEPTDPTEVQVLERMAKLIENKLVVPYEVDGKPFIYIPKFKQRTRATSSKFPEPPANNPQVDRPLTVECPPSDSQTADSRARSSYSLSYSKSVSEPPVDKSRSTPKAAAHSIARAQQVIEDQAKALQDRSPMPEALQAFASKLKPQAPFKSKAEGEEDLPF